LHLKFNTMLNDKRLISFLIFISELKSERNSGQFSF
jgi:hypothetical protein